MIARLNNPDRNSLALNVFLAVGATLVLNGLIFALGWDTSTGATRTPAFEPPGWLVGLVWTTILFPLMATARWQLNARLEAGASGARATVTVLLACCLIWPLYSLAIGSLIGGLIGNLVTIAIAVYAIYRVLPISRNTALLIVPVVLWVMFATAIIVGEMGVF
jgi:tryptophan-rich sensory protein